MGLYRWLYPGLRIKRWIALCAFGVLLCSMGFALTIIETQQTSGSLFVVLGIAAVIISIRKIIKSIFTVLTPVRQGGLLNEMYYRGVLNNGPRIVAIGGGTGLSVLLQGLKERTSNLTAIVTVSDDGGSSGRLRSQFNVLPPGDIRNCLVALADDETMMRDLFQFRFKEEASDLSGHSFGNLFILAMSKITGDFEQAVQESSRILNIRGRVVPSTLTTVTLAARHADGTLSEGETRISSHPSPINEIFLRPGSCKATSVAIEAIHRADAIVLGPGSLYTSVLPNLLIRDLLEAVVASQAPRIYVCNIMTQQYETAHLPSDFIHVDALIKNTVPELLTHCIVNNGTVPRTLAASYAQKSSYPLKSESAKIKALGYEVIETDLVWAGEYVRHHSKKLAKLICEIAQKPRLGSSKPKKRVFEHASA